MPKLRKRQYIGGTYANKQWSVKRLPSDNESSSEDDERNTMIDNILDDELITFLNTTTINDIANVFGLANSKAEFKLITVLLYMTLEHFGINWRQCNYFFDRLMYFWS